MSKYSVGVFKLQPWEMVAEEKYSAEGNLEAHYYHAKDNNGKVLFTTKSGSLRRNPNYVLLALSNGKKGVMYRLVEQGRYPDLSSDPSFEVPSQWKTQNKEIEQTERYYWFALEVVSGILTDLDIKIEVPRGQSPRYSDIRLFKDRINIEVSEEKVDYIIKDVLYKAGGICNYSPQQTFDLIQEFYLLSDREIYSALARLLTRLEFYVSIKYVNLNNSEVVIQTDKILISEPKEVSILLSFFWEFILVGTIGRDEHLRANFSLMFELNRGINCNAKITDEQVKYLEDILDTSYLIKAAFSRIIEEYIPSLKHQSIFMKQRDNLSKDFAGMICMDFNFMKHDKSH